MPFHDFRDYHERLQLQNPKRSFRLHSIDRAGIIIPVGHHLTIAKQHRCVIQRISCAAASLNVSPRIEVPHNFFLVILGSSEEIGATVVRRDGDQLLCKFNMFLDAGFLQGLVGTASIEVEPISG
jgi:hypothetical protein